MSFLNTFFSCCQSTPHKSELLLSHLQTIPEKQTENPQLVPPPTHISLFFFPQTIYQQR